MQANMPWSTEYMIPGIVGHTTAREVAELLEQYPVGAKGCRPVSVQRNHP